MTNDICDIKGSDGSGYYAVINNLPEVGVKLSAEELFKISDEMKSTAKNIDARNNKIEESSDFLNGMIYRLSSDELDPSKSAEWKAGFIACLRKLSEIDTAINGIVFEFLASRELWENFTTLNHTDNGDIDEIGIKFKKDIHIGLQKIATNSTFLCATKLYELVIDPKESRHYAPLLEELDKIAFEAIKNRFSHLKYDALKKLRNKSIAHISNIQFPDLDALISELIPTWNLSDFLETLNPEINGSIIGIHTAADRFRDNIAGVPGYDAYRQSLAAPKK